MPSEEIAKPSACIVVRSGIEIWIPEDKLQAFDLQYQRARQSGGLMLIDLGDGRIERQNPADVVGVYSAQTVEEARRRKNGQWQCREGTWHDRGEKCECVPKAVREIAEKRAALIKACGKCQSGFIQGERGMRRCDCVAEFDNKHNEKKS